MGSTWEWIFRGLIALLVGGNIYWLKRFVTGQEAWRREHERDHTDDGGYVTRNKFFEWCKGSQNACPAKDALLGLRLWREGLTERGIMTRPEHAATCKEVMEGMCHRVDELFKHYHEWIATEIKRIEQTMETKILKEIIDLKKEMRDK